MRNKVFFVMMFNIFLIDSILASNDRPNFFKDRYRGWIWFEENKTPEKKVNENNTSISPEEARLETEDLKRRLDSARDVMIARPTPEAVKDYIKIEEEMWSKGLALDSAYRQAKFLYPEYFDKLQDPQNVHAVKFKRKLDHETLESKIKDFATKYDLVLFSSEHCSYCKEFLPVLKRFSEQYAFKTEEVSLNGKLSGIFPGKNLPELAKNLGIEATPTVVVVAKDGSTAIELIRGYAVLAELEEYVSIAIDYLNKRHTKLLNSK